MKNIRLGWARENVAGAVRFHFTSLCGSGGREVSLDSRGRERIKAHLLEMGYGSEPQDR